MVSGDEEDADAEAVEAALAQARDAEVSAEELLVDDGWKLVESLPRTGHGVEPEAIAVNGNGTNGHHDAGDIGPTVELVPGGNGHTANGNGHAPVPVNGNGHHEEADEPQQSLFSWAEFMAEEPVKPKRRNGKPQPATLSMFEWAVERELEAEPVGAGR